MAKKALNGVLHQVRKLAAVQAARTAADQHLLQEFIRSSDEAALTVLIERYGPMVHGVCRRALVCPSDADDAFQATFLVFSRKAASIRKTASLSSWLHGVARRVAAKLKREIARRQHRERVSATRATRDPADEVSWAEVQAVIDEELERLPERCRAVLILCYLDGKTRDEAAEQLGMTPGTLHGLLERGRKRLAERLTKRGITLSAGLLGVAVCDGFAHAALSPTQIVATVHAASLFAIGKPIGETVSAGVLQLSHQVLKGMLMTKLKFASASVICSALLISTVGFGFAQPGPVEQPSDVRGTTWKSMVFQITAAGQDTDEAFIKRVSKDLRGNEPTPTEVHFFVNNKDPKRRETLVDLFIKEREVKRKTDAETAVRKREIEDAMRKRVAEARLEEEKLLAEREAKKKAADAGVLNANSIWIDLGPNALAALKKDKEKPDVAKLTENANVIPELLKSNVDRLTAKLRAAEADLRARQMANEAEISLGKARVDQARMELEQAAKRLIESMKKAPAR